MLEFVNILKLSFWFSRRWKFRMPKSSNFKRDEGCIQKKRKSRWSLCYVLLLFKI